MTACQVLAKNSIMTCQVSAKTSFLCRFWETNQLTTWVVKNQNEQRIWSFQMALVACSLPWLSVKCPKMVTLFRRLFLSFDKRESWRYGFVAKLLWKFLLHYAGYRFCSAPAQLVSWNCLQALSLSFFKENLGEVFGWKLELGREKIQFW